MNDNYQKIKNKPKKGFSRREDDYIRFNPNSSDNVFDEEMGRRRKSSKKQESSFLFIPQEMKKFRAREAEKVREHLSFMIFAHCCFLFLEVMVYNVLVTMVISEVFYLWLVYYAYMTLSECMVYSYIGLMFIAPVTGIFRVLDVGLGLSTLLYLC